jgi:hypothetical protein
MQSDPIVKVIDEEDGRKAAAAGAGQRRIVMPRRPATDALPAIRVVDEGYGVTVADSPDLLWTAIQDALRRRRDNQRPPLAVHARPADFADAMRRVEDEVYDAD